MQVVTRDNCYSYRVFLMKDSGKFSTSRILVNLSIMAGFTLLTFVLWQVYIHMNFPLEANYEGDYPLRHFTEGLGHGKPFWYHFYYMGKNYGEAIYIPVIWFIAL